MSFGGGAGSSRSGGGNTQEDKNGIHHMKALLDQTLRKLAKVKEIDEAVLGEDGIVVKLAEAEARLLQVEKTKCRVERLLDEMESEHAKLEVDVLVDDVRKEVARQGEKEVTKEDEARHEALQKIEAMEERISQKLKVLRPEVDDVWQFMSQDKEVSMQQLIKTLRSEKHRVDDLCYQLNELKVAVEDRENRPPA